MGVSSGQLVNQHGKQVLTLDVDFVIRSETSPARQRH
jgi:hypothetical protein